MKFKICFLRLLSAFIIFTLVVTACLPIQSLAAEQTYATVTGNNVNIRSGAGTGYSSLGKLSFAEVIVLGTATGTDGMVWYNVQYGDIVGYIRSDYIEIKVDEEISFEEAVLLFPESYRAALYALHESYPNWTFIPHNLSITFDEALEKESKFPTKLIPASHPNSLKSMGENAYNWSDGTWNTNAGNWVAASREVIAYYMDPRNFLDTTGIFMFASHEYDPDGETREGVESILKGTFLLNGFSDTSDYNGSYVDIIMAAAEQTGVSAYMIASTLRQEQGVNGTSGLISGTYSGYEGYYNFWNIGASGTTNTDVIVNGLKRAVNEGWSSRSKSIIGGAQYYSNTYFSRGQNTYYYKNFDVRTGNCTYQYAQNIFDSYSKGVNIRSMYIDDTDGQLQFYIPVYEDMWETAPSYPQENDSLNNYYFTDLGVPNFSMYTQTYSFSITGDTNIEYTLPSGASYIGQPRYNLNAGDNTVLLEVEAQTGAVNTYTLNINASSACVLRIGDSPLASGACGNNAQWTLEDDGTLIISGSGETDGYKFVSLAPWYEYSDIITEIEIADTITKIGNNGFGSLTALKRVVVNDPDLQFGYYVFPENTAAVIYGLGGSYAQQYANENGITYIKPQNPETPVEPVLQGANAYSITLTAVEGYEYSLNGSIWQTSNVFNGLNAQTQYTVYQRIAESAVYAPSVTSGGLSVSTAVSIAAPVIASVVGNIVTLEHTDGYEYSLDGVNWQSDNVFTGLDYDTVISFYRRTSGDISLASKCIIVSAPRVLVGATMLKVKPIDGYEYCLDDMVWQDSNVFKRLIPDMEYIVYQRPKATDGVYVAYNTAGTAAVINGQDVISSPTAQHLVMLRQLLLNNVENNLCADFNDDGEIDIMDLVRLKKILAE